MATTTVKLLTTNLPDLPQPIAICKEEFLEASNTGESIAHQGDGCIEMVTESPDQKATKYNQGLAHILKR